MSFKSIAVIALVGCVSVVRLPAAALSPIERQHLVAHLEMTAAWLADEIGGLTPAQIDFHPNPDAWNRCALVRNRPHEP